MDSKGKEEAERSEEELGLLPKSKGVGSMSSKDMIFRADKIDLKSLDVQLERHVSKVWSRNTSLIQAPKEDWEIDMSRVSIRYAVAKGTFGTVYKGQYNDQDVAVKIFDWGENSMLSSAAAASVRLSFRQEVAVWHKLDHPNVTKFLGASMGASEIMVPAEKNSQGNGDDTYLPTRACCVIVEFIGGGTLKNYLIKHVQRKLPYKIVIQLALDLSRGLSYLHSQKIVHRDVKTENILVDRGRKLKIADFGVARVEAQNPKDMTGETGTLGYMAPEVLEGKPYNRKCDVYSFGICLWEIYCCEMPYSNLKNFLGLSHAVVRENARPPIPRCCPSALAAIMRRCWDARPDNRPEMSEVVTLLEAIDTSKGGGMIPEDQQSGCFCLIPARGP